MPSVTLTSLNMGPRATEADFKKWVAYVTANIASVCGFEVEIDLRDSRADRDEIRTETEGQEDTIRDALATLWQRGRSSSFNITG